MSNFVSENRNDLSKRHYIRKASAENYWFDFTFNKVEEYKEKFGLNFCLVIYGSEQVDDAYVMPFREVASFFDKDQLDDRGRWIGNIRKGVIYLNPGPRSKSISMFYNTFELLDEIQSELTGKIESPIGEYNLSSDNTIELKRRITEFNNKYQFAIPHKKIAVSEQVSRPGAIADYLKEYHSYTCQLCKEVGFLQANGLPYIEAHHIKELHKLLPGSYCSDNIIVVCANCHRKLHYATISIKTGENGFLYINVNGEDYEFRRTIISEE